jgi:hypothetical protein
MSGSVCCHSSNRVTKAAASHPAYISFFSETIPIFFAVREQPVLRRKLARLWFGGKNRPTGTSRPTAAAQPPNLASVKRPLILAIVLHAQYTIHWYLRGPR